MSSAAHVIKIYFTLFLIAIFAILNLLRHILFLERFADQCAEDTMIAKMSLDAEPIKAFNLQMSIESLLQCGKTGQ